VVKETPYHELKTKLFNAPPTPFVASLSPPLIKEVP